MSKIVVCGAGLSGLITANIMGRISSEKIVLIGPDELFYHRPRGPWFYWATPESGKLLGLLNLNPRSIVVKIGYWDGEILHPTPPLGFVDCYAELTSRKGGPVMTSGLSEFVAYNITWTELTDRLVKAAGEIRIYRQPDMVQTIEVEDELITKVNHLSVHSDDWVIITMPLPNAEFMIYGAPRTIYKPVGFANIGEIPFEWNPIHSYVYCQDPNIPWYRITRLEDGTYNGETMNSSYFPEVDLALPIQTPGMPIPLGPVNCFQVGRAARGDRSKVSDAADQVFTIERLLRGK